jgi:hypothetical protein
MNELLDVVSDPTLVEQAATLSNPDLAHTDFGLYSLFLRADWVVKIVMIGLVMASRHSEACPARRLILRNFSGPEKTYPVSISVSMNVLTTLWRGFFWPV